MTETWRLIGDFPDYEVSSDGRVRRCRYRARNTVVGAILKPFRSASGRGYPTVTLCRDASTRKRGIHVLVCTAFHGPRPSPSHEVAHENGTKTDCRALNLRWATKVENAADRLTHGSDLRGLKHPKAKLSPGAIQEIRKAAGARGIGRRLAAQFGVSEALISMVRSGRHPTYLTQGGVHDAL